MANIPFTHLDITDGTSQVNKTNMQTLFDALRKVVAKANRGATEYLDADLVAGTTPGARGLTALSQATTLDADTVSGSGIGVDNQSATLLTTEANIDAIAKGGIYKFYSATVGPFPGAGVSILACPYGASAFNFFAMQNAGALKTRYTGQATWRTVWSTANDGNGGQPPAPKPTTGTPAGGANGVGQFISIAQSTDYTVPGTAGTLWAYNLLAIVIATGVIVTANTGDGIITGGSTLACPASSIIIGHVWRMS